jgi:hypothetical protein
MTRATSGSYQMYMPRRHAAHHHTRHTPTACFPDESTHPPTGVCLSPNVWGWVHGSMRYAAFHHDAATLGLNHGQAKDHSHQWWTPCPLTSHVSFHPPIALNIRTSDNNHATHMFTSERSQVLGEATAKSLRTLHEVRAVQRSPHKGISSTQKICRACWPQGACFTGKFKRR